MLQSFISPIISAGVAFAILYINYLRDKKKSGEGDEKTWRKARLDEEKRLDEKIGTETQARVQWQLKNEADLASIADILEESTEAQKLLAGITATSKSHEQWLTRHDSDFTQLHQRLQNMDNNLHAFIRSHVKPA